MVPHALRNVLTGDISKVLDVIEIRPRSADGPQGAFLRLETPGITRPIQKHRAGKRVHAEICFFPEFFALQLEGQNLGSKRGRLKSAKHYPYREQEEEHHKSKMQRFKKRRNTKQSKQQEAMC